jgi:glycosyltransferase involved in cell wall biosynthesis
MNQLGNITNPLISVILPVRNAEQFLPDCLESLMKQNYQNIEVIAIDDNSNDTSWKVLRTYRKQEKRLKVFKNVKKYGLPMTLNRCLKRVKGKFIAFMDPRDSITKNKLQKQLTFLLENPKVVAVGTQCVYLNEDNKRIGKSTFPSLHQDISQKPLHGVSLLFEGIMINKYRIPKDLLYFPTYKNIFVYTNMAMKLLQFGKIVNLPEYLQFHRKHNSTLESTTSHFFSLLKIWINSRVEYNETPSFRSFFGDFLKPEAA